MLHSDYWTRHICFHHCFSFYRCSSNLHIFDSCSSFPWMNFKTSVSSRGAYLDYHCLLAQWMEVSISVTTARFTEQTRNSKAALWLSLHQRSSPLLDIHYLVGFWKRRYSGSLIWNSMVYQIMTQVVENPTSWVWTETVDKPSCRVFTLWCMTWSNHFLCWKIQKSMWNLFGCCKLCSFSNEMGLF